MAGRRSRSGPGSERSGPVSDERWAWSPATPPYLSGLDILERSPGRWSPSQLGRPPRRLLMVIAALVLASVAAAAIVAHGGPAGRARLTGPEAQAVGLPITCLEVRRHDKRTLSTLREPVCSPAGEPGQAGLRLALPAICLPLQLPAGHLSVAVRPGTRRRPCYPVMPGTGHAAWPREVITMSGSG
jgi:hypothetical protein